MCQSCLRGTLMSFLVECSGGGGGGGGLEIILGGVSLRRDFFGFQPSILRSDYS